MMDRASKLNQFLSDSITSFKLQINSSASAHGGLGLVTTESIPFAQDVICRKQMLVVADNNHLKSTCDNCFLWLGSDIGKNGRIRAAGDAEPSLGKCSCCKVMRYCSESCQRKAWKNHHKAECKIFAQQKESNEILRATVRLLLNRRAGIIDDSEWSAFMGLLPHVEDYIKKDDMLEQAATEAARWAGWNEADEIFKATYCRVRLNCMGVHSLQNEYLGIGLDPLTSLVNHSCKPNAYCLFEGSQIRVRSLEPIPSGDEVTILYIDNTIDKYSRQSMLKSRWFFICCCSKCSSDAGNDSFNIPEGYTRDSLDKLNELASPSNISDPDKTESAMLEVLSTGTEWPAHIRPLPPLYFNLAIGYRAKQNHRKEVYHLLHLCFVVDPVLYPSRVDPTRVCNLFMLTMALHKLAKDNSTVSSELPLQSVELVWIYKYCMWKAAEDALTSHGKNSNLWKALNARLIDEAALVGDPRNFFSLMATDQIQGHCSKLLSRLLLWAGIDPS